MARDGTTLRPRTYSSIERMEEETRALEGMTARNRWMRWIVGIVVLCALLAAAYLLLRP